GGATRRGGTLPAPRRARRRGASPTSSTGRPRHVGSGTGRVRPFRVGGGAGAGHARRSEPGRVRAGADAARHLPARGRRGRADVGPGLPCGPRDLPWGRERAHAPPLAERLTTARALLWPVMAAR